MRSGGEGATTSQKGWARGGSAEQAGSAAARRAPSRMAVGIFVVAILAAIVLWLVPLYQVDIARQRLALTEQIEPASRLALEHQLLEAENGARATLALILAAAGLLFGSAIIWRRYEISRELKTHERFAQAVEHLGSERGDGSARTEARLGGIYALERLASESEREYWPVIEVLTAYVRENAAWRATERGVASGSVRPPADIQAIVAVLGRRHAAPEGRLLDLRETDLRGANLSGSRLDGITLQGAHLDQVDASHALLTRCNLRDAHLAGASLSEADLEGASLARANLEGARLNGANLKGADLSGCNLRGADLWEANLRGCNFKDADLRGADLSQCVLDEAILWRANLQDAVLTGAHLRETHLERANLAGATGLTWEQGEDAFTDENTVLPEYLLPEEVRQATATAGDNVVQLQASARRTPSPKATPAAEAPRPKKAAVPKHRKPGLVKPA